MSSTTPDDVPTGSEGLHDPVPYGYRHTTTAPAGADLVFVAGQYASDAQGAVSSPDFAAQLDRALTNLATALAGEQTGLADVVQLRTYVVGLTGERLGAIGAAVGQRWGDAPPTNTLLGVASLATPDMLVEVEAVAVRT